ncbi:EFR1 family ferrodoxin [Marinifilum caeruleilacunae]|uniref:Uncharacterized protein n=1 Tax=Marinifilum caeruleilacunae TaxID=2499076 RepID=A0ABX1WZG3_9BACT|nr:EFR1 family ferrodoxin [Marinifilum caeruleilacunae]NOU61249.1 hypothetical protein [Marinifilum caeruleilacunae]
MKQTNSKYDKIIIYYFSGTGNAKNASLWIANLARENGIETKLINIDKIEAIEYPDLKSNTLVGFCSPTHGFNLPPITLEFIYRFPKVKKLDAFILNTRAGLKLSQLFIPGLSGLAQILPALLLRLKGFNILGMQPLDLPSNWLFLHPGLKEKVVHSIYQRCHKIVSKFTSRLLSGKKTYRALLSLPIDIALLPIAIAYYFIGRFFLAKTLIATHSCNLCNKCIEKCPVQAIRLVQKRPFWTYKCESCMRCVNKCNQRAIETAHSFATVVLILTSLVISPLLIALLQYLSLWEHIHQNLFSRSLWSVIDALVFILFTFISYGILHFLMKYKWVNLTISYTSLSFYKFWRRYKAPKY